MGGIPSPAHHPSDRRGVVAASSNSFSRTLSRLGVQVHAFGMLPAPNGVTARWVCSSSTGSPRSFALAFCAMRSQAWFNAPLVTQRLLCDSPWLPRQAHKMEMHQASSDGILIMGKAESTREAGKEAE
jgi:hypothetical protein